MTIRALLPLLLAVALVNSARGDDQIRFLLVPLETSIKPHGSVECDLYLYNDGKKATKVPSFEIMSKISVLHDLSGTRLPRGDSSSLVITHSSGEHNLQPGKVEKTRVSIEISAEAGDLAEVYVEIGKGPMLRSNSVLLYCPSESAAPQQASSPKSTITPQGKN